jgi:hypothetical protein
MFQPFFMYECIAEIIKGSSLRLIGTYVASHLRWGIITGKSNSHTDVEHLKDGLTTAVISFSGCWLKFVLGIFGISRYTSGSHLMACVLALERGWHPQSLKFDVQGNFKSTLRSLAMVFRITRNSRRVPNLDLRDGVNGGKSDAFLWEHFTTKPFVDSGVRTFFLFIRGQIQFEKHFRTRIVGMSIPRIDYYAMAVFYGRCQGKYGRLETRCP